MAFLISVKHVYDLLNHISCILHSGDKNHNIDAQKVRTAAKCYTVAK